MGLCKVPNTKSWISYQNVSCNRINTQWIYILYFVFKGDSDKELMRLDWFTFQDKH